MKKLILILVSSFTINQSELLSQRKCDSYEYLQMQNQNETIRENRLSIENRIQEFLRYGIQQRSANIYTIPVVIHIVMENPNDVNVAQIQSQLEVLNEDYRALNADISNVPSAFQNLISDSKFEFVLANVGPDCNGITRTVTNVNCFDRSQDNIKKTSAHGHDPIDPENLLNIWVGRICNAAGPIRGYGQSPGGTPETDGVVISPDVFGTLGTAQAPYDLGRTATHEIGHYFNLIHIWGDDDDCNGTDEVDDTPNQAVQNTSCQDFPHVTCNNGPNGDLFMNYMDYVHDDCMYMFTLGQSARMTAALLISRPNLIDPYICCSGTINMPTLSTYDITLSCPYSGINLNDLHIGTVPSGTSLIWSTDADPTDGISPQIDPLVFSLGTYYAYYLIQEEYCYGPASQGVEITHPSSQNIHIGSNTSYNSNMEIFGNLYIENGATLTITSTIKFGPDSKIIVESNSKLLVDGGTLTACSPKWKGVWVAGEISVGFTSQLPGEVELKNNAIIEKAVIGIDGTDIFSYPGLTFEHGGGIITINNSTIQNCYTGIKLASYGWGPIIGLGTPGEQSVINESTIQDCGTGIYSDGNIGLVITKSTFEDNYNDYEGYVSAIVAERNSFKSLVVFFGDFPFVPGSTFKSNYFIDGFLETSSNGNFTKFKVENNYFSGGSVFTLGELWFEIVGNDFHDTNLGTGVGNTGDNIRNIIKDNAFYNNRFANSVWGTNDVEYISNCFENTAFSDIEINDYASIFEIQGRQQLSAGNCFVSGARIKTGIGTEHFTYWTKDGFNFPPQSCKSPGSGNFTRELAQNETSHDLCGSSLEYTGELPPIYQDCECYSGNDGCKDAIAAILEEIESIERDITIDTSVKVWLISKYKQCIDNLIRIQVQMALNRGEIEETIAFLNTQPEFRYQIMAYGIMNQNREYDDSRNYLNSLFTQSEEQDDFVAAQNIYLNYITDISGFALSASDKSILEEAGKRENELAGYARSIYYRLTGEKIVIDLPHLDGTFTPRSSDEVEENITSMDYNANIFIYPNPSNQNFVEISIMDFDPDKNYTIRIHDVFGRELSLQQLNAGQEKLIIDNHPGIYLVAILIDGHIISIQKLIKL